jgi:hypothetical protein
LRRRGEIAIVGGDEYVLGLADAVPTATHAIGYATAVHEVGQHRRVAHGKDPVEPNKHDDSLAWARKALAEAVPTTNADWPEFRSMADVDDAILEEAKWVVRGVIGERAVVAIAGEPKSTKTWFGLEIVLCIASGDDAGVATNKQLVPCEPKSCVVFCAEDELRSVRIRLRSFAEGRGWDRKKRHEVFSRIFVLPRRRLDLCDADTLVSFVAAIHELGLPDLGLIMLDPLIDVCNVVDENAANEMKKAADVFRALRDVFNCALIFVHHASKSTNQGKGSQKRGGQKMRGSSALHGKVDGGIYMSNVSGDDARKSCEVEIETRSGRPARPFSLTLDIVDDDFGVAVASSWRVGEQGSPPGDRTCKDVGQQVVDVLTAVRDDAIAHGLAVETVPQTKLRTAIGCRGETLSSAIRKLESEGKIKRGKHGGYVLA